MAKGCDYDKTQLEVKDVQEELKIRGVHSFCLSLLYKNSVLDSQTSVLRNDKGRSLRAQNYQKILVTVISFEIMLYAELSIKV